MKTKTAVAFAAVLIGFTAGPSQISAQTDSGDTEQSQSAPGSDATTPGVPGADATNPNAPNVVPALPAPGHATKPQVNSQYAVLMDADSGQILWSRNPDVHRSIASTTKILTATILLEHSQPDDVVVAPPQVVGTPESSLHLVPGETITVHDLVYAMMLRSANDTAIAAAVHVAGSLPAFADMMNEKAAAIGVTNSHFVTPNGLYDPDHYSTAADMARIARYALLNVPLLNDIVKTRRYTVTRSIDKKDSVVTNTASKFLKEFPGADGVKTGYIRQAGHCFVASATRGGWRLIAVALNSNRCREDDESLLNYGFANFTQVAAVPRGQTVGQVTLPSSAGPVDAVAASSMSIAVSRWKAMPRITQSLVPDGRLPIAPGTAGAHVGVVQVKADGHIVATEDALQKEQVPVRPTVAWLHGGTKAGGTLVSMVSAAWGIVMLLAVAKGIYARTTSKGHGGSRDSIAPEVRGDDL